MTLRFLTFLRIVDRHDRLVSLTNVALIVTIYRLATVPAVSFTEVALAFTSLLAYNRKKVLNKGERTDVQKEAS